MVLFQGANYENSQIMNQVDINYSHVCACLDTVIFFRSTRTSIFGLFFKNCFFKFFEWKKASTSLTRYQWRRRTFFKLLKIWILWIVQLGKNHFFEFESMSHQKSFLLEILLSVFNYLEDIWSLGELKSKIGMIFDTHFDRKADFKLFKSMNNSKFNS